MVHSPSLINGHLASLGDVGVFKLFLKLQGSLQRPRTHNKLTESSHTHTSYIHALLTRIAALASDSVSLSALISV